jgi:hypothetical protein
MRAGLVTIRALRPLLPPRYRYIGPYQEWRRRERGRGSDELERLRRRLGIDLDRAKSLPD